FAHQQILFIHDNAVATFLTGSLDLGAQVDFAVLQQFDRLPVGQMVFQVAVEAVQRDQIADMQVRDAESVQFFYSGAFPGRKGFRAALFDTHGGHAYAAEGVAARLTAAAAGSFLWADRATIGTANGSQHFYLLLNVTLYTSWACSGCRPPHALHRYPQTPACDRPGPHRAKNGR